MNEEARIRIHRAPWLVPILAPVLADGGLAIRANRICALGPFQDLARSLPEAEVVEHPETVLLPGLVNAHIHLELSHLDHLGAGDSPACFTGWIEALLAARAGSDPLAITRRAGEEAAGQWRSGVAVLADIGNTDLGLEIGDRFPGPLFSFREFLGISEADLKENIQSVARQDPGRMCTAHAPYSTHSSLLQTLKKRAAGLGHCFPIHVAESEAEIDLVTHGRGEFREFLVRRGLWDSSFQPTGIDNSGSVQYLQNLGLLDEQTLCVHCVQVSRGEVELLAAAGARVCLCPGSNRFLDVGTAPVPMFLEAGMLPALGTDSRASNPELSLWREMRLLAGDHPAIDPATILAMATLGGARALGLADRYGSLLPEREAAVLAVRLGHRLHRAKDVPEYLVRDNRSITVSWLEER